jgi:hypothetical protein
MLQARNVFIEASQKVFGHPYKIDGQRKKLSKICTYIVIVLTTTQHLFTNDTFAAECIKYIHILRCAV